MSLFTWFTHKTSANMPLEADSSGLGQIDATVPFQLADRDRLKLVPPAIVTSTGKSQRLEKRELLYGVVREAMVQIGVLSSRYKFKVLSLDSRGSKYLIMMDLAKQHASEAGKLGEIEGLIAKSAKARHNISVTSVYWRVNEYVLSPETHAAKTEAMQLGQKATIREAQKISHAGQSSTAPTLSEEVEAFKQALSSIPTPKKLSSPGEILRSSRRKPAAMPTFADTEFLDEAHMPLSGTQYGDLN
jgi:hypothetical protein